MKNMFYLALTVLTALTTLSSIGSASQGYCNQTLAGQLAQSKINELAKSAKAQTFIVGGMFWGENDAEYAIPYLFKSNNQLHLGEVLVHRETCETSEGRSSSAEEVTVK